MIQDFDINSVQIEGVSDDCWVSYVEKNGMPLSQEELNELPTEIHQELIIAKQS